jgi:hypothetical protein
MPERDWTWPQGKLPQTWAKMWACAWSQNIPFDQWQETRGCGQRKWIGNRWRHLGQNQSLSPESQNNDKPEM